MEKILIAFEKDGDQWSASVEGHPENYGPEATRGFGDNAPEALRHLLSQPDANRIPELTILGVGPLIIVKLTDAQLEDIKRRLQLNGGLSTLTVEPDTEDQKDAARWRAVVSCDRLRVLGSANLGIGPYQHIGLEIWTQYNSEQFRLSPDNGHQAAMKALTLFADTIIEKGHICKL